ncbi:phosphoribosyltransferase [Jiella avicenniae]|uniref:Phosphoribosyltransferase n=1 Tax=Jiella avicenniae TaxID=2907202 RepID=A0A9X1T4N8_9HYPH|nr:phosphoribosyltransferase [Jiella avicenniae]MCE7027709.1 phosphoribosyltransferase [Jiella avicenniae]MCE7028751.1 phosphoribosyltransferase [Jiella avicenniae]
MSGNTPSPASSVAPSEVWQTLHPPGSFADPHRSDHRETFPASLPDGRQIVLPIRPLPDEAGFAVASLIVNQASFAVEDALMDAMAAIVARAGAEIVVAVPTLGLTLANGVARRLGHPRMVALGTTRKFWYDDALSEPSSSISSRKTPKTLFVDPRLVPLLIGRRVAVVDDVVSTGSSLVAVLRLLGKLGVEPVVVAAAMLQTDRWRVAVATALPGFTGKIAGVFATPLLRRTENGCWRPVASVGDDGPPTIAPAR